MAAYATRPHRLFKNISAHGRRVGDALASFLFYRALGHRDGRLEGTTKTLRVRGLLVRFFCLGLVDITPARAGASAPKVENKVLRRSGLALFALGLATR